MFQDHLKYSEENCDLKKRINDKKGNIECTSAEVEQKESCDQSNDDDASVDFRNVGTYVDNIIEVYS